MIGSYNDVRTPCCGVSGSRDARLANMLGALSTGLTDGLHESTVAAAGLNGAAPAALIALLDFSARGSVQALSQVVGLTHSGAGGWSTVSSLPGTSPGGLAVTPGRARSP